MALDKGHRLGPYEIESHAGSGGMGEVYRAKDTRLDRIVAIKVLPAQAALNVDARARFDREARTISGLNHPNICTLHDIGHEDAIDYLVMEFLEGETLDDRLKRGRMEIGDALEIGGQIAGALDAAHRKGVIHRDLKPSNIFLTKDGAKLLDFGLAKLRMDAVTGLSDDTRTTPVTGEGTIVGTLQYMSPEQLEGREADARSDIFSFGATLYEMVTGQRAYLGSSKASLIGSIMKDEPRSISELQPTSPPALDRLIKKCLQKDPDNRWQSAKDLKDELDWIASAGSQAGIPVPVSSRRRFHMRLAWVIAVIALCMVGVLSIYIIGQERIHPRSVRFRLSGIEGTTSMEWPHLSPDGSMIALVAEDSLRVRRIWIRPLNSADAYALQGTEGVYHPFWSPDSKYLAFFTNRQLKKVTCTGGPVQVICDSPGEDGSWSKDGLILFDGAARGISGVSASGGIPQPYTIVDSSAGEVNHGWPWFLPDGVHFLYHSLDSSGWVSYTRGGWKLKVKLGSINSAATRTLLETRSRVEYCKPGYLLYMLGSSLVAHPFNADKMTLISEPLQLVSNMPLLFEEGGGFSASNNGDLAFLTTAYSSWRSQGYLVRVDRTGNVIDTIGGLALYGDASYSPDNRRIAYSSFASAGRSFDITIYDLNNETETSIMRDQWNDAVPVWSADASTIAYTQGLIGSFRVCLKNTRDAGASRNLELPDSLTVFPVQWTRDNRILLEEAVTTDQSKIPRAWLFPADHPDSAELLLNGPLREIASGISPDGRYLLEVLHTGDKREVYVVDLEQNRARRRVSGPDGDYPRWRSDGGEIYYVLGNDLMAVSVKFTPGLELGKPERLFKLDIPPRWKDDSGCYTYFGYDATSDGKEFVTVKTAGKESGRAECEVILNWTAELKGDK